MTRAITLLRSVVGEEGSTRSLALLRIGLGLALWSRFARDLMPFRSFEHPDRVAVSVVFYLGTFGMVAGWFTPVAMTLTSASLAVLVWYYGGTPWDVEEYTHHHVTMHMLTTFWLTLTPCGRSLSVDRWLAVRRAEAAGAEPPPEWGPTWGRYLLALQVSTLYFWSGIDKVDSSYWNGAALQHIVMRYYTGAALPDEPWFVGLCALAGTITIVLELVLFWGLFVPRLRPPLMAAGILLHLLFYVLIPVNTFSVMMVTLYLAFLPPDTVHDALERLMGRTSQASRTVAPDAEPA